MLRPATLLLVLLASSLAHATFIGSPLLGPYVQDSLASQPKAINSTTSLLGSTVDALISAKYGNATAVAWRRLVSGGGSVDAVAGPVLGGDIVCYVGPDGGVAGLRYGPALVCDATADAVTVSVGEGFVERVDIYLGASAKIAGLVFVVHPPSSYEPSVAYPCGTTKGPHAWIGERGKAVGALAGGCTTPSRRRALLQSSNGTLSAAGFKAVLVPAPPPGTPSSGGYGNGNFTF
jgi:hypothetical protein